ncbi:MAG: hypothetical protein V1676_01835 [Candidatus Diapherotrites archaeon]
MVWLKRIFWSVALSALVYAIALFAGGSGLHAFPHVIFSPAVIIAMLLTNLASVAMIIK